MNREDINIGDIIYWNTTGAYNTTISLIAEVLDIGMRYIWIQVKGNLSPTPVESYYISKKPLYKVTNKR